MVRSIPAKQGRVTGMLQAPFLVQRGGPRTNENEPSGNIGASAMTATDLDQQLAELRSAADAYAARHQFISDLTWPEGVRIAVNFTCDFDAMLLRRLLNEPPMQLAKGEFGGQVGVWRLIELFDAHGVKATIFTPGQICELYPQALRAVVKSGHEIADHMWEHRVPKSRRSKRIIWPRLSPHSNGSPAARPAGTRSSHSAGLLRQYGYMYRSEGSADQRPYYEFDSLAAWDTSRKPALPNTCVTRASLQSTRVPPEFRRAIWSAQAAHRQWLAMAALIGEMRAVEGQLGGADNVDFPAIHESLAAGIQALEQATQWMLQTIGQDLDAAFGASVNYMMLTGYVRGGWQMARAALAAKARLTAGADEDFCRKIDRTVLCRADPAQGNRPADRGEERRYALALEEEQF